MNRPLLYPAVWFDSPKVLDCSIVINNIPGAASPPLEVIASAETLIYAVHTIESTNEFIGIYMGAAGQEVLRCIVGGSTPTVIDASFAKGSRISVRSMGTTAITSGSVCCQFMGVV